MPLMHQSRTLHLRSRSANLDPVGEADPGAKAEFLGQRQQGRMPEMLSLTIGIPLPDNGAGVIE